MTLHAVEKPDGLLTVNEAAEWLSCGRTKVYELIDSGDLPFVRIGSHRRIDVADLRRYVERQKQRLTVPPVRRRTARKVS